MTWKDKMKQLLTHHTHSIQAPQSNTKMDNTSRRYQAFLLRIWREDEQTPWRIQIENPHTREIIGFQNIEKLVSFLNEQALRPGGCAG
jgi:hypothetical protein